MANRDKLHRRLADQPADPLAPVREFLAAFCSDADGIADLRADVRRSIAVNPQPVRTAVDAIDRLLTDPPRDGTLVRLIELDGNWPLAKPTDDAAIAWLAEVRELLHDELVPGGSPGTC